MIWEDGSRKVNMNEPNLRIYHGNFWPVMSQAVRKPCFSTSIPRGPNLCILDFQTPPPAPAPPAPDEFSNPDPGPSQRTQGWNTSARETLAVDMAMSHLFRCMDCAPPRSYFGTWTNMESDKEKICRPSANNIIRYFSVCHWVVTSSWLLKCRQLKYIYIYIIYAWQRTLHQQQVSPL